MPLLKQGFSFPRGFLDPGKSQKGGDHELRLRVGRTRTQAPADNDLDEGTCRPLLGAKL